MALSCLMYCVLPIIDTLKNSNSSHANSVMSKKELPRYFIVLQTLALFKNQSLIDLVKDALIQSNDQEFLKLIIEKISLNFGDFKWSQTIVELLEFRIKYLEEGLKNKPKFSWKMPNAHLPQHPNVDMFLKSDRYSLSYMTKLPVTFAKEFGGFQLNKGYFFQ